MNVAGIHLLNEFLAARIVPEFGGKIVSLYARRGGHEWLWRNFSLEMKRPGYEESYVRKLDTGGWDEIFPSVDPWCVEVPGAGLVSIPDHGDLVRLPWEVEAATATALRMGVTGKCLPFRFTRELVLEGAVLEFNYRVENLGAFAFPWLWCCHPLIPVQDDLRIHLPDEHKFLVTAALGRTNLEEGMSIKWGDLPPLSGEPYAVKLFSEEGSVDTVTLQEGGGAALGLHWDTQAVPFLGIWLNNGHWSGCGSEPYRNIGIEPTTWPADTPENQPATQYLQPGEVREWKLAIRVM